MSDLDDAGDARRRRLAETLRRGHIATVSPEDAKCDDPYGPCGSLTLGTSYRCGYYVTVDESGQLHYENRRQSVECIAKTWLETGVSPHTGRKIVSVLFDDTHCDVARAPAAGSDAGDGRIIGREDLVRVLVLGDDANERSAHATWLETLDTKRLCELAKERMAENYRQLREQIQEWSDGAARSLSDDDLTTVAKLLNVSVPADALSGRDLKERRLVAVEMLAKVAGMEPKGYKSWARWFRQKVRHTAYRAVGFFKRYGPATTALVVVAALCVMGGCAALASVPSAVQVVASQYVAPLVTTGTELYSQYNTATELAGYVQSGLERVAAAKTAADERAAKERMVRRTTSMPSRPTQPLSAPSRAHSTPSATDHSSRPSSRRGKRVRRAEGTTSRSSIPASSAIRRSVSFDT